MSEKRKETFSGRALFCLITIPKWFVFFPLSDRLSPSLFSPSVSVCLALGDKETQMSQMHNIKFSKMYGSLRSLVHQDKITLSHSSPIKPHTLRVRVGKYQWRNKGQTGPRGDQKTSQPTVNLSLLSIDQFSNNSFVCWFFPFFRCALYGGSVYVICMIPTARTIGFVVPF